MPNLITIEEAECPACEVIFPLDGFDTEDVDANEIDCPECGATLCPEPGTFDAENKTVKLMEFDEDEGAGDAGEEEEDDDDEGEEGEEGDEANEG